MSKVVTRASRAGPSTTTITDPASVRRQGVSTRAYQAYYPAPEYTVSTIERNGVRTEVLTIEDTPPPVAGPSGTRNGSSRNESSKKRKNEGGENGERASKRAYDEVEVKANGSKNKRKMESDDGRHGSGSSRSSEQRPAQRVKVAVPVVVAPPLPIHDKEGHFIVRVGDVLLDRYKIIRSLGQGTFGKVVCAWDPERRAEVAVKVIRAVPKYREASKIEIKVLEHLKRHDPSNRHKCIHLMHCFDYQNHVCLVSELLSSSVFDFLKENSYIPFPFSQIQSFARQLLGSVAFLHTLKLIHTDLKPENILLADANYFIVPAKSSRSQARKVLRNPDIRLIDFGSATFEEEYHASVVSTRHYRAPEIILGLPWSYPCDAWSIGCILIEFFTGEALFQTHENLEHLAMMKQVFGDMPVVFGRRAARAKPEWFVPGVGRGASKQLDYPNSQTSKQSKKFVKQMRLLNQIIPPNRIEHQRFLDLLRQLLQWDPDHRITVKEALEHPFFQLTLSDEATAPPPVE